MIVDCTAKIFKGLKNPYTGTDITVKMLVGSGPEPLFSAVTDYTTADTFPDARSAHRAWSRVGGIESVKDGQPVVCAYTGAALTLEQTPTGYRYTGGGNPRVFQTRASLLKLFGRDAGGSEAHAVSGKPDAVPSDGIEITEDSDRIAAQIVAAFAEPLGMERKPTVHMSGKTKSPKK